MHVDKSERRKNPRVFFLKNEDVEARLQMVGGEETFFQALVKDLSRAGIGFLLERTVPVTIRPGDRLVINQIRGADAVDFLTTATLKVEWVLDTDILDHIGFGCSFLELNGDAQAKLDKYILA